MNDRELVLELCRRLNLERKETANYLQENEFCEEPGKITIGSGDGYHGFIAEFDFTGDTLTGHAIWE